jgi:hypothetical protein
LYHMEGRASAWSNRSASPCPSATSSRR